MPMFTLSSYSSWRDVSIFHLVPLNLTVNLYGGQSQMPWIFLPYQWYLLLAKILLLYEASSIIVSLNFSSSGTLGNICERWKCP
jgi:hypothetical protein